MLGDQEIVVDPGDSQIIWESWHVCYHSWIRARRQRKLRINLGKKNNLNLILTCNITDCGIKLLCIIFIWKVKKFSFFCHTISTIIYIVNAKEKGVNVHYLRTERVTWPWSSWLKKKSLQRFVKFQLTFMWIGPFLEHSFYL